MYAIVSRTLHTLDVRLPQVHGQCAYTVGVDANTSGVTLTEQMYYPTFQTYLSAETGCNFTVTLFTSPDSFVAAGLNGSVDVFFAGPGVFVCLQVERIAPCFLLCLLVQAFICCCWYSLRAMKHCVMSRPTERNNCIHSRRMLAFDVLPGRICSTCLACTAGFICCNGCEQLPVVVQSQLGTVPLASLINEVNGKPLSWLAGSAVARANRTDLQTLEDINNQRVSA